jgi:hypothetical protein
VSHDSNNLEPLISFRETPSHLSTTFKVWAMTASELRDQTPECHPDDQSSGFIDRAQLPAAQPPGQPYKNKDASRSQELSEAHQKLESFLTPPTTNSSQSSQACSAAYLQSADACYTQRLKEVKASSLHENPIPAHLNAISVPKQLTQAPPLIVSPVADTGNSLRAVLSDQTPKRMNIKMPTVPHEMITPFVTPRGSRRLQRTGSGSR